MDADGSNPIVAPFTTYADYGARLEVSAAGETINHDVGLCIVHVDADGSVWASVHEELGTPVSADLSNRDVAPTSLRP